MMVDAFVVADDSDDVELMTLHGDGSNDDVAVIVSANKHHYRYSLFSLCCFILSNSFSVRFFPETTRENERGVSSIIQRARAQSINDGYGSLSSKLFCMVIAAVVVVVEEDADVVLVVAAAVLSTVLTYEPYLFFSYGPQMIQARKNC